MTIIIYFRWQINNIKFIQWTLGEAMSLLFHMVLHGTDYIIG